jgi:CsoR family transcriptional regulator, copper-sensing transcriptional repressor
MAEGDKPGFPLSSIRYALSSPRSARRLTYPHRVCYIQSMKKGMDHQDKLVSLRRIEGQIRGVQKMVTDQRYCVDILYAVGAAIGALRNVESKILKDHLNACVKTAFTGKSRSEKENKIQEIYELLERIKK